MTPRLPDAVEHWPLDRLIPYARNARMHDDDQVAQIAVSIVEFGWTNPILVDAEGGIVAERQRSANELRGRKSCEEFGVEANVENTIQCPDFVKMHRLGGNAVDSSLGLGQEVERPLGKLPRLRAQSAPGDDLTDIRPGAMCGRIR